jgi:hypothetical protein
MGLPAYVDRLQIDHATTRNCCWGSYLEVIDLEKHSGSGGHLDPLPIGQTEHLVIIEHSVHVFDPKGIDWPIKDNPPLLLRPLALKSLHSVFHKLRDKPFSPLISKNICLTE